jgi:hypothetical protein
MANVWTSFSSLWPRDDTITLPSSCQGFTALLSNTQGGPVSRFVDSYISLYTHRAGCMRTDGRTDRLHHLHDNNNGLHKEASAPTILLGPKYPLPFSYCLVCFPFLLLRVPLRALPSGPFMLSFTNNKILITNTSVWCQPPRADGSDDQDLSLSLSLLNLQSLLWGPRIECVFVCSLCSQAISHCVDAYDASIQKNSFNWNLSSSRDYYFDFTNQRIELQGIFLLVFRVDSVH